MTTKQRLISDTMIRTLLALQPVEDISHAGASSHEVVIDGGSKYCLGQAKKKDWVRTYGTAQQNGFYSKIEDERTHLYYRTDAAAEVLKPAVAKWLERFEPGDTEFKLAVDFFLETMEMNLDMKDAIEAVHARLVEHQLLELVKRVEKLLKKTKYTAADIDLDALADAVWSRTGQWDSGSINTEVFAEMVGQHNKKAEA